MLFYAAVVVFIFTITQAINSNCPQLPVTANLDIEKAFEGKWYIIAQSYDPKGQGNCSVNDYSLTPAKTVSQSFSVEGGMTLTQMLPFIVYPDTAEIVFPTLKLNNVTASCFIFTDYANYCLSHHCIQLPHGSIFEYAEVAVRESQLSNTSVILDYIKTVFEKAKSQIQLFRINQDGCLKKDKQKSNNNINSVYLVK